MIKPLLIACALALLLVAPAAAEPVDITRQAKAARAEFLLTATPPGPAAAICLVDTGVNTTPDTTGVIERLAIDGDVVLDQSPTLHGTTMASFIGAPANGYGMVGLWPAARIVSVRANMVGQDAFHPTGYVKGMKRCTGAAGRLGIKVIVLALSSDAQLDPAITEALVGEIETAEVRGISVVAAAGNRDGALPGSPANFAGVLPVGASASSTGTRCAFSATGFSLAAPGCDLDGADPLSGQPATSQQGTSHAAAITAAAIAALRTWRTDLTPADARRIMEESAAVVGAGRLIDLTAAFSLAGLGAVAPPADGPVAVASPTPSPTSTPTVKPRLVRPKISIRETRVDGRRKLTVRATNRPKAARLTIRVYVRASSGRYRRIAMRTQSASTVVVRVRTWKRVTAQFTDPSQARRASSIAIASPRR